MQLNDYVMPRGSAAAAARAAMVTGAVYIEHLAACVRDSY